MESIKVLGDRVLILPDPAEKMTKSGLYIPDTAQEKPTTGTVVGAGGDCKEVRNGDRVMYGKFAGTEIELNGEKLRMVRESDIFAIV